jgi:DNA-binding transcriptional LysR family regulator
MPVQPPRPVLPSLNALRAFEAAARHESFVKAAGELGVTAGAIAQQIRLLERWVGHPLFQRFAHGVKLTDEARAVLPCMTDGFDALGDAVQNLCAVHRPTEVQIAALPSIALLWLSPRLPKLRSALAQPLWLVRWGSFARPWFTRLVADATEPVVEVPLETARGLLLRGVGACFLTRNPIAEELSKGHLVEVRVADATDAFRDIALVHPASAPQPLPGIVAAFITAFRDELASLGVHVEG